MEMEFFGLRLTRRELQEVHAALVAQAIVEDELRHEQGLESVDRRPLLEQVDYLLGVADKEEAAVADVIDDGLWQFSWYRFTDEWAWYRAKQEVENELGSAGKKAEPRDLERRIERRYQRDFEKYVKEIEMPDDGSEGAQKKAVRKES